MSQTSTNSLQALRTELSTLPALIAEASRRRDNAAVRRLKERQAELPGDIQNAELAVLEAQIAALDEAEKPLTLAARSTRAKVEEVQAARQKAMELCSTTENAANIAWNNWTNNRNERKNLAAQIHRIELERTLADTPGSVIMDWSGEMVLATPAAADQPPGEMSGTGGNAPVSPYNGRSELGRRPPPTQKKYR